MRSILFSMGALAVLAAPLAPLCCRSACGSWGRRSRECSWGSGSRPSSRAAPWRWPIPEPRHERPHDLPDGHRARGHLRRGDLARARASRPRALDEITSPPGVPRCARSPQSGSPRSPLPSRRPVRPCAGACAPAPLAQAAGAIASIARPVSPAWRSAARATRRSRRRPAGSSARRRARGARRRRTARTRDRRRGSRGAGPSR